MASNYRTKTQFAHPLALDAESVSAVFQLNTVIFRRGVPRVRPLLGWPCAIPYEIDPHLFVKLQQRPSENSFYAEE